MQQLRRLVHVKTHVLQRRVGVSFLWALQVSDRVCSTAPPATLTRWTCACGFSNYAFRAQCFRCEAAREDLPSASKPSPLTLLNEEDNTDGQQHSTTHMESSDRTSVVVPAEGVWMCASCNTFNNAVRCACLHCGTTRPGPSTAARPATPPPNSAESRAVAPQEFKRGDWRCSCGAHNFARNTHCIACHAPSPRKRGARAGRDGARGDWVCPECAKYNFARRDECMQCHHPRPAQEPRAGRNTNAAAEAVAPQEWVCQACHSMNPSDAETACVICGTPK